MTNSASIRALPPVFRAEVCANDHVMGYQRSGSGMPILLMFSDPARAPLTDALMRTLATSYRLIVPELPTGGNPTDWLAEFLEGLGTSAVTLIAAGPLCMAAIELALRDEDQVSRLVLIPDGDADETVRDDSLITTFGASQVPALILRPGLEADATAAIITRFVEGAAHGNG